MASSSPHTFTLSQVQAHTVHHQTIPLAPVSVQLPRVCFNPLCPYLLSHITRAQQVCATGLPQGAQISPLPPLYLHALEETDGPASLELV